MPTASIVHYERVRDRTTKRILAKDRIERARAPLINPASAAGRCSSLFSSSAAALASCISTSTPAKGNTVDS